MHVLWFIFCGYVYHGAHLLLLTAFRVSLAPLELLDPLVLVVLL